MELIIISIVSIVGKYGSRQNVGLTLVESVVALAIFGVAILTGVLLMSVSLRNIRAERQMAYVARVMESTMENVRNLSWVELTAQPASQTFDATKPLVSLFGKAVNQLSSKDDDFKGEYFNPTGTISIETVSGLPDVRKITIKVAYKSGFSNVPVSNSLVTLISKNGIDRR